MSVVYLEPGNWYELKKYRQDKLFPYDLPSLIDEIKNQINNRSSMLELIESPYGETGRYVIDDIFYYLDDDKIRKFDSMLKKETRHPILTFHGSSYDSIESIINNGYRIGGTTDKMGAVKIANGSLYGHGVYTSSFFNKAIGYARPENNNLYLIVNFVILGKFCMIPPTQSKNDPVNGIDTKIVFGLDQLISKKSSSVIPVAVLRAKYVTGK